MWFIIRATFCIGIVFSMVPGVEAPDGRMASPSLSGALAERLGGNLLEGLLSSCRSEAQSCLELARRAAETGIGDAPAAKANAGEAVRIVSDTLTAGDRAIPWRGPTKERPAARLRVASRPTG